MRRAQEIAAYDPRSYWTAIHGEYSGRLEAVGYSQFGEGFNRIAYVLRKWAVKRLLRRASKTSPSSLLEAGVGVGAYGPLWIRLGIVRWLGLDISEEAVRHCRLRYPLHEFAVADITAFEETAAAGSDQFDLVTAIDVLYHLVDEAAFESALRNLAARVRPGGWLLVSDVFRPEDKVIAPHVKRRALVTYEKALGPEMVLVDREPVFSILGDPVPLFSRDATGRCLLAAWRLLATLVRRSPACVRRQTGACAVLCTWPVDAVLRRAGAGRGRNLELALFRRREIPRWSGVENSEQCVESQV